MEDRFLQISFDYCIKCTICNTACPVNLVYPEYPGPKYLGPDSQRFRIHEGYFKVKEEIAIFCTNCKRCELACPSDVKITHFIEIDKSKVKGNPIRNLMFSHIDLVGSISTSFSKITNLALNNSILRKAIEPIVGIKAEKKLPKYNYKTFKEYYEENYIPPKEPRYRFFFFYGCYINYNDLELGIKLLDFFRDLNIDVVSFEQKCCGIPMASAGLSKSYEKRAKYHFNIFWDIIKSGHKIVSLSTSCTMAIRDDYTRFFDLTEDEKRLYQEGIMYFSEFIYHLKNDIGIEIPFNKKHKRLIYHVPCHAKYSGYGYYTTKLLKEVAEEVVVLDEYCCGMAGTYGVKKETYKVSKMIGKPLFDRIKAELKKGGVLVSDCETCRMQIEENTKEKIIHPLEVIL